MAIKGPTLSGITLEKILSDSSSPLIGPAGKWQDGKYMLPGRAGLATHAEILGDIDGFNLGKRIQASPNTPLSDHIGSYYSSGDSQKRFDIFKGHTTKAQLTTQVYRFANLYDYKEAGLLSTVLQNSSGDLAVRRANVMNQIANNAVSTFCTRFSSELGSWC